MCFAQSSKELKRTTLLSQFVCRS